MAKKQAGWFHVRRFPTSGGAYEELEVRVWIGEERVSWVSSPALEARWLCSRKDPNLGWYGFELRLPRPVVEAAQLCVRMLQKLEAGYYGKVKPGDVIAVLQKMGFRELLYHADMAEFIPAEEWQELPVFAAVTVDNERVDQVFATCEYEARQKLLAKAAENLAAGGYMARYWKKWIEQDCVVRKVAEALPRPQVSLEPAGASNKEAQEVAC